MSWFGGSKNSSSSDSSGSLSDHGGSFPEDYSSSATSSSLGGGGGGSVEQQQVQQFLIGLQQQLLVQKAVTELTAKAFQQCIAPSIRPSSSASSNLAGRDVACIHSVVNKWLDTGELLHGRLVNKMQDGANRQQ